MVELVEPDVRYETSYRAAMREDPAEGRALAVHPSFQAFVDELRDHAHGRALPPGWVASADYWVVEGDTYLGRVQVRSALTAALRRYGGHVGYSIRPSARGRGYGTTALGLGLERCRAMGLDRVLVTCDESNLASRRVIEANGGVLDDVVVLQGRAVPTMRFWINLTDGR